MIRNAALPVPTQRPRHRHRGRHTDSLVPAGRDAAVGGLSGGRLDHKAWPRLGVQPL